MDLKELKNYTFPVYKVELVEDYQAGLEGFKFIGDFFNNVLLMIDGFKDRLHILNTLYRGKHINELKDLESVKRDVNNIVHNNTYSDLENKEIVGIAGLKNLPLAAEELAKLVELVNKTTYDSLVIIHELLSRFIADKDYRKSFLAGVNGISNIKRNTIEDIENSLLKFVDLNMIQDTLKLKEVLPNLSSLIKVHENLVDAANKTDIVQLRDIELIITKIEDKVMIIAELAKDDTEITKTSMSQVSEGLYIMGNLVKQHGIVYYVTAEVSKVLLNIVKTLK